MKNTITNIILSIVETKDIKFVEQKVNSLENQLTLNEIEKKIVTDIKDSVFMGSLVSKDFINEKYSYYVENDENVFPVYLSKDAIDSAIVDIRLQQLKAGLSKDLLMLGSQVSTMSPQEIKEKFSFMHNNVLLESKQTMPDNDLVEQTTPYEDLTAFNNGLSLLIPELEKHAGKAVKGSIVAILAFTGSYKSTYSLNLAYQNAMEGQNILYLALEDTSQKIMSRMVLNHIANTAEHKNEIIHSTWLRDETLNERQIKYYNAKHNELVKALDNHLILWDSTKINYQTFMDMTTTLRMADKHFLEKTGRGLDGVVVDQLSLLKYTSGSGKKFSYDGALLNDWVSYFREQALNFLDEARQIVVFLVAQTSRDSYAKASKGDSGLYDASCSSDSHEIERSASTMITIYKSHEKNDTVKFYIPKARNGYQPEKVLDIEAHGYAYHIGALKFSNVDIDAGTFDSMVISKEDLDEAKEDINDMSVENLIGI